MGQRRGNKKEEQTKCPVESGECRIMSKEMRRLTTRVARLERMLQVQETEEPWRLWDAEGEDELTEREAASEHKQASKFPRMTNGEKPFVGKCSSCSWKADCLVLCAGKKQGQAWCAYCWTSFSR